YGRQDVLNRVGLQIKAGERVGLIGPNGAGKTTLFKIILGHTAPDSGQVHKTKGLRLGYLPQDVMSFSGKTVLKLVMDTAEEARVVEAELQEIASELKELAAKDDPDKDTLVELTNRQSHLLDLFETLGGYQLKAQAGKILKGLGFTETDFDRPIEELSGGWIMRAVLARLLLAEPDLLLLDEPTNHLDMDSLLWMEDYLKISPSALLLISHDRTFLNNLVHRIVEIERAEVISYAGNYDQYIKEKEKRLATQAASYANQQEKIKQIERFISRNRVRKSSASQVQSRIKALDKIERIDAPPAGRKKINFSLPPAPRAPKTLIELSGVTKSYQEQPVYRDLDFNIQRGDRIALLGVNGAGKTTLMKLLAGVTNYQAGIRKVGTGVVFAYFAQHQLEELNMNLTVLEEISLAAPGQTYGWLRSLLGKFQFREDDVFKKVTALSGGEKTRLILAKIMLSRPNLLLLDEPSNHLDIPGQEMLEQALKQYQGSLVLISHDRKLINAVANKIAMVREGRVEVYLGNFNDLETRLESSFMISPGGDNNQAKSSARAEREARKRAEAETRQRLYRFKTPLIKEMDRLEKRLEEVGHRLDEISTQLALPKTYQDQEISKALNYEYSQLKAENRELTAAWENKALELEELEESGVEADKLNAR
ncbi:MAG: ATP-binding cassette domain-containing protein, partial [Deltaproteobacteria bacterium]|nr:ATP-binding cassette domain-containing protein [Deltaproteobacteria bacterium]MBW2324286.1 ATP-binding cassette domain-containing protein [Deltaproteobacteria bacterium]